METERVPHRLDPIFRPRSVAVMGVVPRPGTVPHDIFDNILRSGFNGVLYPVAPGKRSISAVKAYRYVVDIPDPVELAVIVFPASVCERALEQCAEKGVKGVIIISAGFREAGADGVDLERRIVEICRRHDMALIGPNCLGVINADPQVGLNASFARKMPADGRIGFLSQSGALCTAVLDYARNMDIGFSKFVSFGNKADVSEIDLLEYLHADPQTDVILLYLEELRDGRALIDVAQRVTRGEGAKPILAIKSGRTRQGASAAASHTGSLAGEDELCDVVFREAGIVRVDGIDELFGTAMLYTQQPMPAGDRIAIVTNAGGPGVMATDAAVRLGLSIPRFDADTTEKLRRALPASATLSNPVDVIGDARADRYNAAVEAVLADAHVDQVLVILTPQSMTDIDDVARGICRVVEGTAKPVACSFMGGADVASGIRILRQAGIPHYEQPERACRAMADLQAIRKWREGGRSTLEPLEPLEVDRAAAAAVIDVAPDGYLPEHRALGVLEAYGFPVPRHHFCRDADEAVAAADAIGYPVVLRVVSPQIVHKFDVKGVALDLADAETVRTAFRSMVDHIADVQPEAVVDGVIVRPMIPAGHEVILGARRDADFGAVAMFGFGGVFVEVFEDVTFALAPVDRETACRMVRQVKARRILEGARGAERADIDTIEQCLVRLGQLVDDFDRIAEMDINPLMVGPSHVGCAVADVRIRVATNE